MSEANEHIEKVQPEGENEQDSRQAIPDNLVSSLDITAMASSGNRIYRGVRDINKITEEDRLKYPDDFNMPPPRLLRISHEQSE